MISTILSLFLAPVSLTVSAFVMVSRKLRDVESEGDFIRSPRRIRTNVMIICGNCSGEKIAPFKTFMDVHGCCEICGGHSFTLASLRGLLHRHMPGERLRAITVPPQTLNFKKRKVA